MKKIVLIGVHIGSSYLFYRTQIDSLDSIHVIYKILKYIFYVYKFETVIIAATKDDNKCEILR